MILGNKTVLVVAAHPDDEVLGCGGTIIRHVEEGDDVSVIFMADGISSRYDSDVATAISDRECGANEAAEILGTMRTIFMGHPDNKMDSLSLLEIVQPLEKLIADIQPVIIYTHHCGDLNIDHQLTHQAVMTACRPVPELSVREIYSFEVLSSTEWAATRCEKYFMPNVFIDISMYIPKKIHALRQYHHEMREFPHSRSFEAVEALARYRGVSVGVAAAEAFQLERALV